MPAADPAPAPATTRRLQRAALGGALVAVAVALGPLDGLSDRSLAAHMVQHVLLINVVAPLLVVGAAPWRGSHFRAALGLARGRGWPVTVTAAALLHVVVVWAWHLPGPYQTALHNPVVHAAEHLSFLGTACLVWWSVAALRRGPSAGAGVVALFAVTLSGTGLGFWMALARSPWYPAYGTGAAALTDQQVAGAVMWGVGGMVAALGGVALFAAWLHRAERMSERVTHAVAAG